MAIRKIFRNLIIIIIVMCNIGCDQISKTIVRGKIGQNEQITYLDNHLTLTKVENSGAALSFGDSWPYPVKLIFLSILPLMALGYAIYIIMSRTSISKPLVLGLCFVIGGGIGNIYDRIIYGSVTDFLHLDLILFKTGIFNMADVSIMVGIFIILIYLYTRERNLEIIDT